MLTFYQAFEIKVCHLFYVADSSAKYQQEQTCCVKINTYIYTWNVSSPLCYQLETVTDLSNRMFPMTQHQPLFFPYVTFNYIVCIRKESLQGGKRKYQKFGIYVFVLNKFLSQLKEEK